jgi:hypothetical protein
VRLLTAGQWLNLVGYRSRSFWGHAVIGAWSSASQTPRIQHLDLAQRNREDWPSRCQEVDLCRLQADHARPISIFEHQILRTGRRDLPESLRDKQSIC